MGSSIPIKNIQEINCIKDLYRQKNQISELLMFTLAINTGIDLINLLNLRVKDIKNKKYLCIEKNKSIPLNEEILKLIAEVIKDKNKRHRTTVFYSFKNIIAELGLRNKYSVASWRKTFAYHYYHKYKDLSYLQWLFNQTNINMALKFIDEDENMNLRYRDGISL